MLAVVHALVEGPRWQMVPAYVLTGLLGVAWLLWVYGPVNGLGRGRGWLHWLHWLALGVGALVVVVSLALPVVVPVFRFPTPSGPYAIGTVTYHWVDGERGEIFTADPADHRELMVQIWYPADPDTSGPRSRYVDNAAAMADAVQAQLPFPGLVLRHLDLVSTHAVASAPVAGDEPRYPVLLYLSGLYGSRQINTFQVEELVSRGYVVVGLDQPYTAADVGFPDGRHVRGWPVDELRVLVRPHLGARGRPPALHGRALPQGSAGISRRTPPSPSTSSRR